MSLIIPANTLASGGFSVDNSVRFNDGDSSYMYKTGSSGNRKTWTFSCWVKRGNLTGVQQHIIQTFPAGTGYTRVFFEDDESLSCDGTDSSAGNAFELTTNRLFRDVSAWYHIVVALDTTQGTASNRLKIYVNGTQETSFETETYPAENIDYQINRNKQLNIGRHNGGSAYFNGYMAEVVLIDGQQLAPTEFGEFDEDSGIWKPIDVSGLTFGTNGFYLDFEDSANLGNDANGGTDFTEVNLAATDQSTDTCTNNFATMNPLDNYYAASTFSEGNLKTVQGSSRYAWNLSTMAVASGKWYAEVKFTTSGSYALIGITDRSPLQNLNDVLGSAAYDYSIYQPNGDLYNNAGLNPPNDDANYAASYANGDIIGIALDCDNNKLYFSKGGAWSNGSGSWDSTTFNASTGVVTITAPASTNNGNYFFAAGDYESGSQPTFEWNFGSPPFAISSGNQDGNGYGNFEYAVPSSYYALNTKNLAEYG